MAQSMQRFVILWDIAGIGPDDYPAQDKAAVRSYAEKPLELAIHITDEKAESPGTPVADSEEHRASCHRCGNLRKKKILCTRCPYIFCSRCCEKMKEEHGSDVFSSGCPVCKELCCCGKNKSMTCDRKHHCYKKCPLSKAIVRTKQNESSQGINETISHSSRKKSSETSSTSEGLLQSTSKTVKRTAQRHSNFRYPVFHSILDENMVDFGTVLAADVRRRPVFDHTQPYYLSSSGTLEPTERPLLRDAADKSERTPSPSIPREDIFLPQLPAIPSRIRWDLISNPLGGTDETATLHHHMQYLQPVRQGFSSPEQLPNLPLEVSGGGGEWTSGSRVYCSYSADQGEEKDSKPESRSKRRRKGRLTSELLLADGRDGVGEEEHIQSPFSALTTAATCTGDTLTPFQAISGGGGYSEFSSINTPPCTPLPSVFLLSRSRNSAPLTPLDCVDMDYADMAAATSSRATPQRVFSAQSDSGGMSMSSPDTACRAICVDAVAYDTGNECNGGSSFAMV